MRYSELKPINTENVGKEKRKPGLYILVNQYGNEIYIGSSTQLRHRLKAVLYGRSDYAQVPGKQKIRKEATHYKRAYTPIEKARRIEGRRKKEMKYNEL